MGHSHHRRPGLPASSSTWQSASASPRGVFLLALLSVALARAQPIAPWKVIGEHLLIGLCVVALTHYLGYHEVPCSHLNEGHAALLVLALLEEKLAARGGTGLVAADILGLCTRHASSPPTHLSRPATTSFRPTSSAVSLASVDADGYRPAGPDRC